MKFITDNAILSTCQIVFKPGKSIWWTHVDLEARIKLAHHRRPYTNPVTLDSAKAYDGVEHAILINALKDVTFPQYI